MAVEDATGRRASTDRPVVRGTAVAVGTFVGVGVLTGLIPNPAFARMVPRAPPDYLFLALTSLLAGAYVAQGAATTGTDEGLAVGGTLGGFLAVACPVCNHLLLALASSSAIMTVFDPLRPAIGAVSVTLLAGAALYRRRRCSTC